MDDPLFAPYLHNDSFIKFFEDEFDHELTTEDKKYRQFEPKDVDKYSVNKLAKSFNDEYDDNEVYKKDVDNTSSFQLQCKQQLMEMDLSLNLHILAIFTPKMLLYLPMYNITYSSVSQYIITKDSSILNIECNVRAIVSHFVDRKHVLNMWLSPKSSLYYLFVQNSKQIQNYYKPKQKVFTDEQIKERKKLQMKNARAKYAQSDKGKQALADAQRRYRDKNK